MFISTETLIRRLRRQAWKDGVGIELGDLLLQTVYKLEELADIPHSDWNERPEREFE